MCPPRGRAVGTKIGPRKGSRNGVCNRTPAIPLRCGHGQDADDGVARLAVHPEELSARDRLSHGFVLSERVEERILPPVTVALTAQPVVGDAADPVGRVAASIVAKQEMREE